MDIKRKFVLQLGLFVHPKNEKLNIRTSSDRTAEMFLKYGIDTVTVSYLKNKFLRLYDTVYTTINKRNHYDIAVVPLFGTWPSFIWQTMIVRLLKLFKKKVILRILGGSIPERTDKGAQRFIRSMKRADVLIAPSAYMSQYFKKKGFNIQVLENPIDLSQYKFHQKKIIRPRILWMRAFTEIYNPAMAIRVAKRLSQKYNDFEMVMAGKDGPLTIPIKKMAEESGLHDKIVFPGYINMQEKLVFANDYDIYICTNKIDNAPVSLIEFMSLGLPVVSVNVGGIPYLIKDEQNGLLVNNDDDEAMFLQICRLIEDPSLATSICCNAYEYAQQYDEKNVIGKWTVLIKEMEKYL
jgi:glycosyltransferase involved in cell wall biosynthesis